jgi:spore germination protein GerM
MNHEDDELAALLRDAMREEASQVSPAGDGLAKIRARVAARRDRFGWFLRPSVAAVALAAALLGGTGIGLLLARDDTTFVGPAATGSPAPAETPSPAVSPSPATPATPSTPTSKTPGVNVVPPASSPQGQSVTFAAPVYWLGDVDGRLRLYREFFSIQSGGDKGRAAVTAMLEREPYDADYLSVWPSGTKVLGVERSGGVAAVNLSAAALSKHAPPETARMAVQQLVWTLTAADQDGRERVRLLVEGQPVRNLWESGVSVADPVGRSAGTSVLAPVWITEPQDGATVGRTVTLEGQATVIEANVTIEVREGETVVQSTFATASEGAPGRGTWSHRLSLAPGSYEIRAFESSAQDGRPLAVDSKRVTVR